VVDGSQRSFERRDQLLHIRPPAYLWSNSTAVTYAMTRLRTRSLSVYGQVSNACGPRTTSFPTAQEFALSQAERELLRSWPELGHPNYAPARPLSGNGKSSFDDWLGREAADQR
jgi:hypothetical protein